MNPMSRMPSLRGLLVVALVILLAGVVLARRDAAETPRTVSAHFPRAVSVFVGSDVRILGVTVGEVTAVTPEGDSVRVEMSYDGQYRLPADAKAAVVTPTLVADRFVQLTPVYREGDAVMADGADIALPDTAVPVELDRIYSSLRDLTEALGPNGVNADGTLNHLLDAGSRALDGQGKRANRTLNNLAQAATTFADNGGQLFETVRQLAEFTSTLAENDQLVEAFLRDLADVSDQLAAERGELRRTLAAVADAVGTVETFVRGNRERLTTDVEKLSRVVRVIASERDSLDDALRVAPVAMGNLFLAYNVETGTIGSRIGVTGNAFDADGFLCAVVQQSDLPTPSKRLACQLFSALLEQAQNELPSIPPGPGENPLPLPGLNRPATGGARVPAAARPETDITTDASLADLLAGAPR